MQPELVPPANVQEPEDKEVTASDLFDLAYTRALRGLEVTTNHLPGVKNQHVTAIVDTSTQTDIHVIASERSGGEIDLTLAWHNTNASTERHDNGFLTFTKTPSGEITVKGSTFDKPIPDHEFHRFGLLWTPIFEEVRYGKPEPLNSSDFEAVYAHLKSDLIDRITQRDIAVRLEFLYTINDPKTPALTKLRFYDLGRVSDLFTDNELRAFAPKGYEDVKSILFLVRTRLARLGQVVKRAVEIGPWIILDQAMTELKKEEAKEHEADHHGH